MNWHFRLKQNPAVIGSILLTTCVFTGYISAAPQGAAVTRNSQLNTISTTSTVEILRNVQRILHVANTLARSKLAKQDESDAAAAPVVGGVSDLVNLLANFESELAGEIVRLILRPNQQDQSFLNSLTQDFSNLVGLKPPSTPAPSPRPLRPIFVTSGAASSSVGVGGSTNRLNQLQSTQGISALPQGGFKPQGSYTSQGGFKPQGSYTPQGSNTPQISYILPQYAVLSTTTPYPDLPSLPGGGDGGIVSRLVSGFVRGVAANRNPTTQQQQQSQQPIVYVIAGNPPQILGGVGSNGTAGNFIINPVTEISSAAVTPVASTVSSNTAVEEDSDEDNTRKLPQ